MFRSCSCSGSASSPGRRRAGSRRILPASTWPALASRSHRRAAARPTCRASGRTSREPLTTRGPLWEPALAEPAVAGKAGAPAAAESAAGPPSMPPRPEPRPLRFTIEATVAPGTGMRARLGRLETPHGIVETPQFMPVGTNATVKALDPGDLEAAGASIVLANTYHLFLRPGHERIERLGGLHRFMGWDRPILTDSGGYQVVSLADARVIDADGATFRSHIDGATHRLTPDIAIPAHEALGPDLAVALDHPVHPSSPRAEVEDAMERTHAWAEKSLAAHTRPDQALFGIVQGGVDPELRERSTRFIAALPFDGICIGGLAGDETPV